MLDLNQQQHVRSICRLHRICRARTSEGYRSYDAIKITGESVKFIGSKHIQESHINMSLQLYISYLNKHIVILRIHISLRLLRSVHTLNSKLKFKTILNKQITTTTESSVPWSDLNFPKVCSNTLLESSTLSLSYQLYVAIRCIFQTVQREIVYKKRKPHTMSEKRRKIKKIASYQNIIVRNCPALGNSFWRYAHDPYTNPLAGPLLIALQVWISFRERVYGK